MAQMVKNLFECGRPGFNPWVGKIPSKMEWLPTPVLLPGKCHGQASLGGYSLWSHKESGTTQRLNNDYNNVRIEGHERQCYVRSGSLS